MFNFEVVKVPEYKELYDVAVEWDYGTTHTHDDISDIMRLNQNTTKYHNMINKANKMLTDSMKMLKNIKGKGYIVVNPEEYVEEAVSEFQKGNRRIKKGYTILDNTPVDKLEGESLTKYRRVNDSAATLRALVEGKIKEIKVLSTKQLVLNKGRN